MAFGNFDKQTQGVQLLQRSLARGRLGHAYLFAGNLLLKANRAEEALQMFEQYLHLAPKGQYANETQKMIEKIKKAVPEKKKINLLGD